MVTTSSDDVLATYLVLVVLVEEQGLDRSHLEIGAFVVIELWKAVFERSSDICLCANALGVGSH